MKLFTLSHWAYLPKNMFLSPKLRLLAHKGPLGPLRTPFRGPLNSSKTKTFRNNNFFCFTLSDWAYLPKIMFLSPKMRLLAHKGPLGPLMAPFKGPLNSSKSKVFKRNIFSLHSFVTLIQHTKKLCLYAHNYVFWLLGPFLKIKGPLKGQKCKFSKIVEIPT